MRWVLVEVPDNEAANDFAAEIAEREDASLVGLYAAPVNFCECPKEVRQEKNWSKIYRHETSARGKSFGWWIKRCCMKPLKQSHQQPYNLLEKDTAPPRQRYRVVIWTGDSREGKD